MKLKTLLSCVDKYTQMTIFDMDTKTYYENSANGSELDWENQLYKNLLRKNVVSISDNPFANCKCFWDTTHLHIAIRKEMVIYELTGYNHFPDIKDYKSEPLYWSYE